MTRSGSSQENHKIPILLVDLSQRFGGVGVRVMQLAALLGPRFHVSVAVIKGSETEARLITAALNVIPISSGRRDPRTVFHLIRILREIRPLVIDLHNVQSQLWGLIAATTTQVPVRIATFHSVYELSESGRWRRKLYRWILPFIRRSASQIISVSETIDEYLDERGVPISKRAVIANGAELSTRPATWASPFSRGGSEIRIACVGRLVPVKGHAVLLNALAGLSCEWDCLVVGDGPERTNLQRSAQEIGISDRVRFLGYRQDVADILASVDLFCMPSLSEGLPYALLEAALLERPIVASAVGGIARYFRHQETICFCEAGQVGELRDAIQRLMNSPNDARAMGIRARHFVEQQFSVRRMANETADFYAMALAEQAPRI